MQKYQLDRAVIGRLQTNDIPIRTKVKKWCELLLIRDPTISYTGVLDKRYDSHNATKDEIILLHLATYDLNIPFITLDDFNMPGLKLSHFVVYVCRSGVMFALLNAHIKQVPSWVATITNNVISTSSVEVNHAKICAQYIFASCFLSSSKLAYSFRTYLPKLGLSKYFTEKINDSLVDKVLGEALLESKMIEVMAILRSEGLISHLQLIDLDPFNAGGAGRVYDWIATNNSEKLFDAVSEAGCELYVNDKPKSSLVKPNNPIVKPDKKDNPLPKSPPLERQPSIPKIVSLPMISSSALPILSSSLPAVSIVSSTPNIVSSLPTKIAIAKKEETCPVCLDNKNSNIALVPCGHTGICEKCLSELPNSICPICIQPFTSKLLIFKVSAD
jgi:hypothetical protein